MRTVRKSNCFIYVIVAVHLLFVSCKENKKKEGLENKDISLVDFSKDTVVYKIAVKDDDVEKHYKESFYVVRNFYVNNINLGTYTAKKEHKAIEAYRNSDTINLYLKYSVLIKEKNKLIKLWDINTPNTDNIIYPVLEQGVVFKKYYKKNNLKPSYTSYNILRIKSKRDEYQDFECLNFRLNYDNSWVLISKEKLNTTLPTSRRYCIDTISKNLNYLGGNNESLIIFHQAFDDLNKTWQCF